LFAAADGYVAVVELLLAMDGIDIGSEDKKGRTALLLAKANGHEAVVDLLLKTDGIAPNSTDKES
jgi:ankyrin repeat protein